MCTHPIVAGVFEVSETATPPCVYHTPNERVLLRRGGAQILAWVLLAAVVVGLGYAVARLVWWTAPEPGPRPQLELAVETEYEEAAVGEPYTVTAIIYNTGDVTVEDVRVEIAKQSLEDFELRSVRPPPGSQGECGQWWMLSYGKLMPHERRRVSLDLAPKREGELQVKVRLVSGEHIYHGMTALPVLVGEETGPPEMPGPLEEES
jgi:hypothetical protein